MLLLGALHWGHSGPSLPFYYNIEAEKYRRLQERYFRFVLLKPSPFLCFLPKNPPQRRQTKNQLLCFFSALFSSSSVPSFNPNPFPQIHRSFKGLN
ncbi:hypothetical protein L3X38_008422 [Prunus dulcis]|uniref:Uncharacterized protein n=1 Tax=Prunus dulcis TaxID=3755 RepID=A0AAD4ZWI3_PRUDU|nr:hypothetical protein L3X38_008422 [Prunus dulcis]